MPRIEFATEIEAPIEKVWAFYDNLETLPEITPPSTRVTVPSDPVKLAQGVRFLLIVRQPPFYLPIRWETIITEHRRPTFFVDEQGEGPFAYWRHEHLFEALSPNRMRLRDSITYRVPFGIFGWIADGLFIRPLLRQMFAYRHRGTHRALDAGQV
jgi:ligand-binding SRPBCC domain-containing protein